GIDDIYLDDNFYDTKFNVNYAQNLRDMSWNVELGGLHQRYNWYGLSQPIFNETHAQGLNVAHTFYGVHVGGDLTFQDAYIDSGSVLFRRFGDDQGSGESHFNAKVSADIAISDFEIATKLTIDYLGGSFDR